MDEKIKSKVLIYIIVILVLSVLTLAIVGIMGYKYLIEKIFNIEQNKIQSAHGNINQNVFYQNTNKENDINEENNKEGNEVAKTIQLNEDKYDVKLEVIYDKIKEEEYTEFDYNNYYNSKYNILINGNVVTGIKEKLTCKGEIKETDIDKIKDINGKEYLLLYTYVYNPANISYINLYMIDPTQSNKIIGVIEHKDNVSYSIDEDTRLEFKINSDSIVDYIYNLEDDVLEKHKYVIEDKELKDIVEETYKKDRVTAAGAV